MEPMLGREVMSATTPLQVGAMAVELYTWDAYGPCWLVTVMEEARDEVGGRYRSLTVWERVSKLWADWEEE
jgi:hypothetical protein